jgi:hypothetical protein
MVKPAIKHHAVLCIEQKEMNNHKVLKQLNFSVHVRSNEGTRLHVHFACHTPIAGETVAHCMTAATHCARSSSNWVSLTALLTSSCRQDSCLAAVIHSAGCTVWSHAVPLAWIANRKLCSNLHRYSTAATWHQRTEICWLYNDAQNMFPHTTGEGCQTNHQFSWDSHRHRPHVGQSPKIAGPYAVTVCQQLAAVANIDDWQAGFSFQP